MKPQSSLDDGTSPVRWAEDGTGVRLALAGEIDMRCREELTAVLDDLSAQPPADVTADLARVTFISSEGLAFLVRLHQQVAGVRRRLSVLDPPPDVRRVFELTDLDQLFTIVESSEQ
jgi:anti-sigma B factor antagonist